MSRLSLPQPARQIFAIAIPAIGESYLQNLLGVVDTFFIAHIGLTAIDAVGITNVYSMTFLGVFAAVASALSVYLARAYGAKDSDRGHAVLRQGLLLALLTGSVTGLLALLFARPLLALLGAQGNLLGIALPYFMIVLGLSPIVALFTAQAAAFRALGDTKTPLRISLEMNIFHVIADYFLIFGIGSFHGLGLQGAAIAMILARAYAFLRLTSKAHAIPTLRFSFRQKAPQQDALLRTMTAFAVPAALERLSMRLGQVVYFGLIVRMGVDIYATHTIAGSLTAFSSTIGNGFAVATTAMIGQAIGAKNTQQASAYRRYAYWEAAILMTLVAILLYVSSAWLGHFFTPHKDVIQLLGIILLIDVFSQPFLASVLIDTAAIQATGNSRYPMITTMIGIWGVRTFGVYLFAWQLHFGLPAVWVCIGLDNALRTLLYARYRNRSKI
nr:MATE family efflux transporter [Bacilli bacterium]